MMLRTPMKKVKKNNQTVALYFFSIVLSFLLVRLLNQEEIPLSQVFYYLSNIFFGISLGTFMAAWFRDPGYLKADPAINFYELL
jgi:flagellar biosynthesis protein FliR